MKRMCDERMGECCDCMVRVGREKRKEGVSRVIRNRWKDELKGCGGEEVRIVLVKQKVG